jgi:hypothetical protein
MCCLNPDAFSVAMARRLVGARREAGQRFAVFGPPYAAVVLAVDITKIEVRVEPEPVHWTRDTLPAAVHRRLR